MSNMTSIGGEDLKRAAGAGCDASGRELLRRFRKSTDKRGASHPQTQRLARWLQEVIDLRNEQDAPAVPSAPVSEQDADAPSAPDVPGAVLVNGVWMVPVAPAATPVTPVRRRRKFHADTLAMWDLHAEGMTAEEIAVTQGKTEGTVRNALSRVRKALAAGDIIG